MSFNIVNQIASQALHGEDVTITFSWSDANANLSNLTVGGKAGVVNGGAIGYISEIDPSGIKVKVKPFQPDKRFDSSVTPGLLGASEVVTFF